jgi:uncharacterized HhH-GPD family protein
MAVKTATDRLWFTGDEEADRLLVQEPLALLIGFELDQQVPLQKAFSGPLELKRRIGSLDAAKIAAMDPEKLDAAFRERPALHRFPGNMAKRTQDLAEVIARDYHNDAASVWRDAATGKELEKRLLGLPGFGEMKAKTMIAILGKQLGVRPKGWEDVCPTHMTLGDVDSPETLRHYQDGKRAYKAAMRDAEASGMDPREAREIAHAVRPGAGPGRWRSQGPRQEGELGSGRCTGRVVGRLASQGPLVLPWAIPGRGRG